MDVADAGHRTPSVYTVSSSKFQGLLVPKTWAIFCHSVNWPDGVLAL